MTSTFDKQRLSAAMERLNKKKNPDLLEIQLNFKAKMGVTYTDDRGEEIDRGKPFSKENRAMSTN